MAMIDIQNIAEEEITTIRFAEQDFLVNYGLFIKIQEHEDDNGNNYRLYKSDIPNLIVALNKAKELGWY